MARPTKLTPELEEQLVQLLRSGVPLKDAAEFCNIHRSQVYRWLDRGEAEAVRLIYSENEDEEPLESERIYLEFRDRVAGSRAWANVKDLTVLAMAADNDPTWAERRLKLRNPDLFRSEHRFEIEVKSPAQIKAEQQAQMLDRATHAIRGWGERRSYDADNEG